MDITSDDIAVSQISSGRGGKEEEWWWWCWLYKNENGDGIGNGNDDDGGGGIGNDDVVVVGVGGGKSGYNGCGVIHCWSYWSNDKVDDVDRGDDNIENVVCGGEVGIWRICGGGGFNGGYNEVCCWGKVLFIKAGVWGGEGGVAMEEVEEEDEIVERDGEVIDNGVVDGVDVAGCGDLSLYPPIPGSWTIIIGSFVVACLLGW